MDVDLLVNVCDGSLADELGTYFVISSSINSKMKANKAGTKAKNIAQIGRLFSIPRGLINHPRFSASVGLNPSGTNSFWKKERCKNAIGPWAFI